MRDFGKSAALVEVARIAALLVPACVAQERVRRTPCCPFGVTVSATVIVYDFAV